MIGHTISSLCLVITSTVTFIFLAYVLSSFYKVFQITRSQLHAEQWLLHQCNDPKFFSHMYTHSDICVKVDNNASIGAFMLAVNEFSAEFRVARMISTEILELVKIASWPILAILAFLCICAPTYLVQASRKRQWTHCVDGHMKYP